MNVGNTAFHNTGFGRAIPYPTWLIRHYSHSYELVEICFLQILNISQCARFFFRESIWEIYSPCNPLESSNSNEPGIKSRFLFSLGNKKHVHELCFSMFR